MTTPLKVISANVQRSIANTDGVLELAARRKCQVVCIQEPPVTFGRIRRHPGFTTIGLDDENARVAIYLDRRFTGNPIFPPEHSIIGISLQAVTIINVYLHPRLDRALPAWSRLRIKNTDTWVFPPRN